MTSLSFPDFRFTSYAWEKFWAFIDIAEGEIGGFGKIEVSDDYLTVSDILLIKQTASQSDFILSPEAFSEFGEAVLARGEPLSLYRLWWHSHAEYKVGWSVDKDERTIATLSRKNYLMSVVGNKNAEMANRYDIGYPFRFSIHNLQVKILTVPEKVDLMALEDEVAAKVRFVKKAAVKLVKKAGSNG